MKNTFSSYYPLDDNDSTRVWETATFVFDTNVLLNLYGYSPHTCERLIELMRAEQHRLWLPYHVVREYLDCRPRVIVSEIQAHAAQVNPVASAIATLQEKAERSFIPTDLMDRLQSTSDSIDVALDARRTQLEALWANDQILDALTTLFAGKVGAPFSDVEQKAAESEAKTRFASRTPPGWRDEGKSNGNEIGDYFIWRQMLEHAKSTQRPIIFVTSDRKEDWWLRGHNRRAGPLPALRTEMKKVAGVEFQMFEPERLLEAYATHFKQPVDLNAIEEIKDAAASRRVKIDTPASETVRMGMSTDWDTVSTPGAHANFDRTGAIRNAEAIREMQQALIQLTQLHLSVISARNEQRAKGNAEGARVLERDAENIAQNMSECRFRLSQLLRAD